MLTLGMTAGNDNTAILVIKITVDASNIFYFSDTEDKITLSSIDFDGKVVFKDSINEFQKGIDVSAGGGIGQVGTFTFALARYNSYSGASDFFDDYFPATSGLRLSGKPVEVGIVWSTATTTSEITWLSKEYIDEYLYSFNQMQFKCIEYNELAQRELPHWKIQKETDDKISYYPNAPKDSIGLPIPLIYGDFTTAVSETVTSKNRFGYAPTILVNPPKNQYLACSHTVYEVNDNAANNEHSCYRWIGGIDRYMIVYNSGAVSSTGTDYTNSDSGYHFTMFNVTGYELIGGIVIPLSDSSQFSDILNIENVIDDDLTNYVELDGANDEISLRVGNTSSSSDLGTLGVSSGDISVWFAASTDGGGNRNWKISYWNDTIAVPATGTNTTGTLTSSSSASIAHSFGNSTTAKKDGTLPWTLEELTELDYRLENTQANVADKIRIYDAYIGLANIKIITIKTTRTVSGSIKLSGR